MLGIIFNFPSTFAVHTTVSVVTGAVSACFLYCFCADADDDDEQSIVVPLTIN